MSTVLANFEALRQAIANVAKLAEFPKFGSATQAMRMRTTDGALVISANGFSQVRASVPVEIDDEIGWDVLVGFPTLLALPPLGRVELEPSGTSLTVKAGKTHLRARMVAGEPENITDPDVPTGLDWHEMPAALRAIANFGGEAQPYFSVFPNGIFTSDLAKITGFVPLVSTMPSARIPREIVAGVGMQFAISANAEGKPNAVYLLGDDGTEVRAPVLQEPPFDWSKMFVLEAASRMTIPREPLQKWAEYASKWAGMTYPKMRMLSEPAGLRIGLTGEMAEADQVLPGTVEIHKEGGGGTFLTDSLLQMLSGMPSEIVVEFVPHAVDATMFYLRLKCDGHQVVTMPIKE